MPQVTVFRNNEHSGYTFMEQPFQVSMVTAAMFRRPKYNKRFCYDKKVRGDIVDKLKSVLRTAYLNGHDAIVLSAWGMHARLM